MGCMVDSGRRFLCPDGGEGCCSDLHTNNKKGPQKTEKENLLLFSEVLVPWDITV